MEPVDNPFTPSFGRVPAVMAGRDILLNDLANAFDKEPNSPYLQSLVVGARGTGKTALLSYMAEYVSSHGWIVTSSSCVEGMLDDIEQQALSAASHLVDRPRGIHLTSLSVGQVLGSEWEPARTPDKNWRSRMGELLDGLNADGTGLLITVDEVKASLNEMVLLATVYQHFVREGRKVALLMAGLPHQVSQLVNDETVSFLRRAERIQLGRIEDADVAAAICKTLAGAGGSIDRDALEICIHAVAGFPYMLQLVGFWSWSASQNGHIDQSAAQNGVDRAALGLRRQILEPTWAALSPGDRAFCVALANGCQTVREIGAAMEKKQNYISKYKLRLLEQGVIEQLWDGTLSFGLPGMDAFVREIAELT